MYEVDPRLVPLAWISLGAGLMLLAILIALIVFVWRVLGAHVVHVIAEAGKRAVDARLGEVSKS
jgi:hypothetical protein